MSDEPRFAVCTFERVFVTEPIQEVVSLQQLTSAFRRFALKEKLYAQSQRELERAHEACNAWTSQTDRSGRQHARLREAFDRARNEGSDPDAAVEQAYQRMLRQAINRPKNGMETAMAAVRETVPGLRNPLGGSDVEIELNLGFGDAGQFLGVGVVGGAVIKLRVRPTSWASVLAREPGRTHRPDDGRTTRARGCSG